MKTAIPSLKALMLSCLNRNVRSGRLIEMDNVPEEDVDLALALLTQHKVSSNKIVTIVFEKYPHLIRDVHRFLGEFVYDGPTMSDLMVALIASTQSREYELFLIARI